MEHLLNLLWLVVASILFALTIQWHVRGKLRCSLPVALGCAALIALTLFPALSMTDDLQRAKLYEEPSGHHGSLLLQRSLDDGELTDAFFFGSPFLLLMAAALVSLGRMTRRRDVRASALTRGVRPDAVRPPPACLPALAA